MSTGAARRSTPAFGPCSFLDLDLLFAPDLLGDLDDEAKLVPLLLLGEVVALAGGGEAALRGQAELVDVRVLGGLLDPALDEVLGLKLAALAGDDAEHDPLALGQVAQRLEAAGALGGPLAEEKLS